MQDPLLTLRSALISDWDDLETLDPVIDTLGGKDKKVLCSTGWYSEEFIGPQITITEDSSADELYEIGYGTIRVIATYQVDVWVPITKTTGKDPGVAKQYKWEIVQEIKRILKANKTGLSDLWYVKLEQRGRNFDDLNRSPPVLRYNLKFSVVYVI